MPVAFFWRLRDFTGSGRKTSRRMVDTGPTRSITLPWDICFQMNCGHRLQCYKGGNMPLFPQLQKATFELSLSAVPRFPLAYHQGWRVNVGPCLKNIAVWTVIALVQDIQTRSIMWHNVGPKWGQQHANRMFIRLSASSRLEAIAWMKTSVFCDNLVAYSFVWRHWL